MLDFDTIREALAPFVLFALFVGFYFLPTITARHLRHVNVRAIFVLNLFLGWSLIGWIVALVWANTKQQRSNA